MQTKSFAYGQKARIIVFVLMLVIVATMWVPVNSYAMDKSGHLKWQLIFLSPYGGCTNYQYQMANEYDEVASKYFELYKFVNSKYPTQCLPDVKYTHYQIPEDLDLLILVYDKEIGKKELHSNDVGGLYNHVGTDRTKNHTIIICDCSNFGFSDPSWILSHELSHFITYYLGFDFAVVENEIHSRDAMYDQCMEGVRNSTCSNVVSHVHGKYYFTSAVVMVPYQPAIGKPLILINNDTANTNVSGNGANLPIVMNMQKEITKWWLEGKVNDTEYTKVLGYMVDRSANPVNMDNLPSNVIFADGPNGKEENATLYNPDSGINREDSVVLKRIPFKQENSSSLTGQVPIPDWFKYRASDWSQNQWSNNDFMSAIKYLFDHGSVK